MPSLDELRSRLRLEAGDVITEDWYSDLESYLEKIEKEGAVDYSGYIHSDLIPDIDILHNLGIPTHRIKEIHAFDAYLDSIQSRNAEFEQLQAVDVNANNIDAEEGNFSRSLKVQGKTVLKDEDPIHIATFYDYAKSQIVQSIQDAILNLGIPATPKLIGYQVDYYAPAMADVFLHNITSELDGRVRVKITGSNDFYSYMKFKPNAAPVEIIAMLNDGNPVKANTWNEFDFTVNAGDEVNVKVFPSTKITILIYNIKEA